MAYTKDIHESRPPMQGDIAAATQPYYPFPDAPVLDEDAFSPDDEEHVAAVLNNNNDADGQEELARQPDGNVATCAQHLHYRFRGPTFVGYSFYEYVGIVSIVPRKEASQATSGVAGRRANARFDFDAGHPWHATHAQVLRSKHCIPILAGRPVCPPGAPPNPVTSAWTTKANEFAAYMITLFHPWDLETGTPSIPMTYTALLQWMQRLRDGDDSLCVHRWMVQVATSLRVNSRVRQWLTQYRSRAAKVWGAHDGRGHDEQHEHDPDDAEHAGVAAGFDDCDAEAIVGLLNSVLESNPTDAERAYAEANSRRLDVVQRLWEQSLPPLANGAVASLPAADALRTESSDTIYRIHKLFSDIRKGNIELQQPHQQPLTSSSSTRNSNIGDLLEDGVDMQNFSDNRLNADQNAVLRLCLDFLVKSLRHARDFAHYPAPEPLHMFLLGGPGTGKSFFARILIEITASLGAKIVCAAPTGIAASPLPNGSTLHSLFGISIKGNRADRPLGDNSTAISSLRNRLRGVQLLIIDEISMVEERTLLTIDKRLQQALNCELPFGGLGILAMGDFLQLPPCSSKPLYVAMQSNSYLLAPTLRQFRMIQLTQQMRAADDLQHTELLNRWRNVSVTDKPVRRTDITNLKVRSLLLYPTLRRSSGNLRTRHSL